MQYTHGADIYRDEEKREFLDFSSNINPLGYPLNVHEILANAKQYIEVYPDSANQKLIASFSEFEKLPSTYFIAGNGAADLIYRMVHAIKPKKALLLSPCFSEYENALHTVDCKISFYNLHKDLAFSLEKNFIQMINRETDIIFLCNPNNPTGRTIDKHLMLQIAEKALLTDTLLVIDECFLDFVENGDDLSMKKHLEYFPNIAILKAYTKIFAMPGARVGYMMSSNTTLIEKLYSISQPWNLSALSEILAIPLKDQHTYIEATKTFIRKERKHLMKVLQKEGYDVYPGEANFILFSQHDDFPLKETFEKYKILIRSCANYRNLSSRFFRIAVRTKEENEVFIHALQQIRRKYQ